MKTIGSKVIITKDKGIWQAQSRMNGVRTLDLVHYHRMTHHQCELDHILPGR